MGEVETNPILPLLAGQSSDLLLARFWSKIEITDTCWLWTDPPDTYGYGRISVAGKTVKAHRLAYELLVGPIPEGLTLDHRCHTEDEACPGGNTCPHRRCMRPEHLEPVPMGENVKRGLVRKTYCKNGHEFTPENTKIDLDDGYACRVCLTCKQIAWTKQNAKRSQELRDNPPPPRVREPKTHCPSGHPYSEENTRVEANGVKKCRTCIRARARARGKLRPSRAKPKPQDLPAA